jgi:hypothetical protein
VPQEIGHKVGSTWTQIVKQLQSQYNDQIMYYKYSRIQVQASKVPKYKFTTTTRQVLKPPNK